MAMDEKQLAEIEARAKRMSEIDYPEAAQRDEMDLVFKQDVPALVAEVRRLRAGLTNIREIQGYLDGRVCSCKGVGCIQCIADATLSDREGELFS